MRKEGETIVIRGLEESRTGVAVEVGQRYPQIV
jgi:hypothetical protein